MEVEVERPMKIQKSNRRPNGEIMSPQVEKTKNRMRPTWQREKTKASKELCLEKMRENFTRQRVKEVRRANRTLDKMSYAKEKSAMNGRLYCDVTQLQNIIRQTAKERLQLERHLVRASEVIRCSSLVDDTELKSLQENNKHLRNQLEELQNADTRLGEKELELQRLREELKNRQELCADLEHQLHATIEKHKEAELHSLDLKQQLQELQPVSEECHHLREALAVVENRYNSAKTEVDCLQGKVDNLEALVKHMREAADRRKELERQHAEAVAELQKKQDELRHLHSTSKAERQHALEVIQNLESKVRELQKKCDLQNVLHEELVLEMAALRRSQSKQSWRTQRSHSADMPNEPSRLDEEMGLYLVGSDTLFSMNKNQTLSSSLPALDSGLTQNFTQNFTQNVKSPYEPLTTISSTSPGMTRTTSTSLGASLHLGISRTHTLSSGTNSNLGMPKTPGVSPGASGNLGMPRTPGVSPGSCVNVSVARTPGASATNVASTPVSITISQPSNTNTTSHEIDRIMARIEQDNRILAELERSRATVGSPVSSANLERLKAQFEEDQKQLGEIPYRSNMISSFSSTALDQLLVEPEKSRQTFWKLTRSKAPKTSSMMKELDVLMAKLEQDNRILAELDKKRATLGSITTSSALYAGSRRPISATPPGSRSSTPLTGGSALQSSSGHYGSTLPSLPAGAPYSSASRSREDDIYNDIDYVDLPHRGRCKVFISRYSYDPLKQSPNENPEAELCLNAGDYVLIFGDMDEDGFFSGELLDGRKGLVPSNFIEKLTGEDLFEFQSQVLYGNRDSDDSSASFTYPDGDEDMHFGSSKVTIEDYHRMNDYIDLEDIVEELEEEDLTELEREEGPVPPPQRLILERQLNKSILIGWMPPDAPRGSVEAYHVYVDGVPKATIRASEKTRALVEGVDSSQPHRISVRSVSPTGRHSRDAACTIVIGKDIPLAPSCVKASNITSTSAVIGWLPSNSNFQHVVAINSVEVKTLKPGVFRHTITGLAPNTTYKVSVRARPARLFINHEKNPKKLGMLTATVEFRTHPKGWLPDPPVDVQIEPGPQDGTLLVTWLPVTINTKGTSNGAPVTGYVVYTGDRKIGEIDSPTGDHALLDMCQLAPLKKRTVTVRTKSGDYLSSESMPCLIPLELLKGVAATMMQSEPPRAPSITNEEGEREKEKERPPPRERKKSTGSSDSESDTELAELLKHVKCRSEAFDPATENSSGGQQGTRVEELVEEGLRSELSDIAEETEEDLMRNTERGERRSHQHGKDTRLSSRDQDRRTDRNIDKRDDYPDDRYGDRRRGDRRDDVRMDRRDDIRRDDRRVDIVDDRHDIRRSYDRRDDRYYSQDRRQDIDSTRTTKHYSSPDHRPHDRSHGRMSPTGMHRDHSPRDRSYSNRPIVDGPIIANRRVNNLGVERRNSAGQVIIEPEENLSDKEIYPQSQHVIPAIEITRDSEVTNPDDEYLRSGRRGYYSDSHRGQNNAQYYQGDKSRGRPVSPMPPSRHYRDQENSYYGHRGHSKSVRDDYYGDGYRRRSSPRGRGGPGADNRVRWFIAMYDYDPQTMSPNPDAAEDELCFQEGQFIKVYGDKDADGFYRGELNGRIGYVPHNMVSEIEMGEEEASKHLMNENVPSRHHHGGDPSDPWSTLPVRKLVAMYDYDPQELSPNVDAEMELAFKTGDYIYVYGGVDEDGFYMGELNGVRGLVPSNFLTEAPVDFRDPKMDRLGPPPRGGGSSRYAKDHREDPQYVRDSRNVPYSSSSGAPKEQMPLDKGRYSERMTDDRSYDRSRSHPSEADRGRYGSAGRSGQHW